MLIAQNTKVSWCAKFSWREIIIKCCASKPRARQNICSKVVVKMLVCNIFIPFFYDYIPFLSLFWVLLALLIFHFFGGLSVSLCSIFKYLTINRKEPLFPYFQRIVYFQLVQSDVNNVPYCSCLILLQGVVALLSLSKPVAIR